MNNVRHFALVCFSLFLFACGSGSENSQPNNPVHFDSADECHVCGMVITRFSGPKGQAFEKHNKGVKKFCSTKDLLVWYLQPENKPNVSEIFVHDMGMTAWDSPNDEHLIPAIDAYFVIGSSKQGSMGDTVATFLKITEATKFSKEFGGEILSFNGLTLDNLNKFRKPQ